MAKVLRAAIDQHLDFNNATWSYTEISSLGTLASSSFASLSVVSSSANIDNIAPFTPFPGMTISNSRTMVSLASYHLDPITFDNIESQKYYEQVIEVPWALAGSTIITAYVSKYKNNTLPNWAVFDSLTNKVFLVIKLGKLIELKHFTNKYS